MLKVMLVLEDLVHEGEEGDGGLVDVESFVFEVVHGAPWGWALKHVSTRAVHSCVVMAREKQAR